MQTDPAASLHTSTDQLHHSNDCDLSYGYRFMVEIKVFQSSGENGEGCIWPDVLAKVGGWQEKALIPMSYA